MFIIERVVLPAYFIYLSRHFRVYRNSRKNIVDRIIRHNLRPLISLLLNLLPNASNNALYLFVAKSAKGCFNEQRVQKVLGHFDDLKGAFTFACYVLQTIEKLFEILVNLDKQWAFSPSFDNRIV